MRDLEAGEATAAVVQHGDLVPSGRKIDPDEDIVGRWVALILSHAYLHALW